MNSDNPIQALHVLLSEREMSPLTDFYAAPYFDDLRGTHIKTPSFISNILSKNVGATSLPLWIGLYRDTRLWYQGQGLNRQNVIFVEHYELIMYHMCQEMDAAADSQEFEVAVQMQVPTEVIEESIRMIHLICQDITSLSVPTESVSKSKQCMPKRFTEHYQERLLAVLIRCATHFVHFALRYYHGIACIEKEHGSSVSLRGRIQEALAYASVTAMSLKYSSISLLEVLPSVIDEFSGNAGDNAGSKYSLNLSSVINSSCCPMVDAADFDTDLFDLKDQVYYLCSHSSVIKRAASSLLVAIVCNEKENASDAIVSLCSTFKLSLAARAFFFGREYGSAGVNYGKETMLDDSSPWRQISSRVMGAIRTIMAMKFPTISTDVLSNLLPVFFSLIDETNTKLQTLGAVSMIMILRQTTQSTFNGHFGLADQVVTLSCKTTRDYTALAVVSFLRFEILRMIGKDPRGMEARRKASADFLSLVSTYGERDRKVALAVLVGGVVPLLSLESQKDTPELIEITRGGLVTLLPLISSWSPIHDAPAVLSALRCISCLMFGGWPVVSRHGGKIMSALLICIGRSSQQKKNLEARIEKAAGPLQVEKSDAEAAKHVHAVLSFAIDISAMTLIFAGDRAKEVILAAEQQCLTELVEYCQMVRDRSMLMQEEWAA